MGCADPDSELAQRGYELLGAAGRIGLAERRLQSEMNSAWKSKDVLTTLYLRPKYDANLYPIFMSFALFQRSQQYNVNISKMVPKL